MAELYIKDKMVDPGSFTIGVVTASGTQYLLMINDINKFHAYAGNLVNKSTLNAYQHMYENVFGIKPTNNNDDNEKRFLQYLEKSNSGLKLFKGDDKFENWKSKKLDESKQNVVDQPC